MGQEFPNPSRSSPDEVAELRAQLAAVAARVDTLERILSNRVPLREPALEKRDSGLGLTVVNRIGAPTLALGILFFFRYAAENN